MTDLDLPALKKLCENLTPRSQLSIVDRLETEKEFIVLGRIARTALPALIEEVERLKPMASGERLTQYMIENEAITKENAALRELLREAREFVTYGLEYSPGFSLRAQKTTERIDAALGEV